MLRWQRASWIHEPFHSCGYLDRRPIMVALAGSNGAGKSIFFEAHPKSSGLRFLNADAMARELQVEAYEAARLIAALRTELVSLRESFIFETVFSDPVGDDLGTPFRHAAAYMNGNPVRWSEPIPSWFKRLP